MLVTLGDSTYREFLSSDDLAPLCERCIDDEAMHGNRPWHGKPLNAAPVFRNFENWWPQLESTYERDFAPLVYGERPTGDEIHQALQMALESFSKLNHTS